MQIDPTVFKAYDIRGVVGRTSTRPLPSTSAAPSAARRWPPARRRWRWAATGACRARGWPAALIRGLVSTGLDVVDIGPVTTPMLYYVAATRGRHGCTSGIQVTGSHNPKDYNGFKMVLAGRAIYGEDIQKLRQRIEAEDYAVARARARAWTSRAEYAARIVDDCRLARPMRIVVDCGNGIPGASAPGHPARPGLRGHRAVQPGRRRLPQPPPGPEQAREPGRPDQGRARRRGRTRPGLRRRRRPPRRRHARTATSSTPTARSCSSRATSCSATRARRSSSTSSARSACRWRSARPAACRCCGRPGTR